MIGEELELLTMERFRESSGRDRRERERESAKVCRHPNLW